jgi:hypothetical protein
MSLRGSSSSNATSVTGQLSFLKFLKEIEAQFPEGLDVHIVMDNYVTHKDTQAQSVPHYHVHFTPTSASWIDQVERWFAELTRKQTQRGVHTSVRQLEARHPYLHRSAQQKPEPLQMDQVRRPDLTSVKRFCHKAHQTLCAEL